MERKNEIDASNLVTANEMRKRVLLGFSAQAVSSSFKRVVEGPLVHWVEGRFAWEHERKRPAEAGQPRVAGRYRRLPRIPLLL